MLHVWYIYLHNWVIFRARVGKYSSAMEHVFINIHPKHLRNLGKEWQIHQVSSSQLSHSVLYLNQVSTLTSKMPRPFHTRGEQVVSHHCAEGRLKSSMQWLQMPPKRQHHVYGAYFWGMILSLNVIYIYIFICLGNLSLQFILW